MRQPSPTWVTLVLGLMFTHGSSSPGAFLEVFLLGLLESEMVHQQSSQYLTAGAPAWLSLACPGPLAASRCSSLTQPSLSESQNGYHQA